VALLRSREHPSRWNQGTAPAGHKASNPSLYERLKPFAEQGGVSHQASVLPNMQLVAGRLEIEADTRSGNEIDSDLMRGARRGPGNGAGKAPIDRAVQVAAQDAFDLRMGCPMAKVKPNCGWETDGMTSDHFLKFLGAFSLITFVESREISDVHFSIEELENKIAEAKSGVYHDLPIIKGTK
jgi:hypothetical protein